MQWKLYYSNVQRLLHSIFSVIRNIAAVRIGNI